MDGETRPLFFWRSSIDEVANHDSSSDAAEDVFPRNAMERRHKQSILVLICLDGQLPESVGLKRANFLIIQSHVERAVQKRAAKLES